MSYWDAAKAVRRSRVLEPEAIARTAARLLDQVGYDEFSLRLLADWLDVAPASLYSRIRGTSDALDLALDHALGADHSIQQAISRGEAVEILRAFFEHLLEHSWAVHVVAMRPPRGPAYLEFSESLVRGLQESGRSDPLSRAYAATNLVIGSALTYQAAGREVDAPVSADRAPHYEALHADIAFTPHDVLDKALGELLNVG
ncbi:MULTISPECIES: TetR/AcrR family transcriptional regulator [Prauserella salsuginis group]|uniref:AcrR family transcriptional regulator n=2 Tax=Prauserella salsuginis group TaxID=2893672 RepID=A0A839XPY8_9PSEU|nr:MULTISPECIES: TetR family transcriptional regulator [Prauserella salsuginis group]MBB3662928.1 AcrR family transcriptional regulator [Prauserella sediminis]MCR3721336.1 transcriptional regulator, TetR family [Prauserella flava]MCR3734584.1 transcriptional regulator, TetR family [Prauserella salsuginis]